MNHFEEELGNVKADVLRMWELTVSQLHKTMEAFTSYDRKLCAEVLKKDKKVNRIELQIDRDCEKIIATHNPVAVDLRFLISMMKINSNLERIGDITKGIAKIIRNSNEEFDRELVDDTDVLLMLEEANDMNKDLLQAFIDEDLGIAMSMFQRDKALDDFNRKSKEIIVNYLETHPGKTAQGIEIREIVIKIERIGDQCCNIAEEIVFYLEAQVLKHSKKKLSPKGSSDS